MKLACASRFEPANAFAANSAARLQSTRGAFACKSVKDSRQRVSDAHTYPGVALNLLSIHSHVSRGPTHAAIMHAMNAHPQPRLGVCAGRGARTPRAPKRVLRRSRSHDQPIDPLTRKLTAKGKIRRDLTNP